MTLKKCEKVYDKKVGSYWKRWNFRGKIRSPKFSQLERNFGRI